MAGATQIASAGGLNFNGFGAGPDDSTHVAQEFTHDVNFRAETRSWEVCQPPDGMCSVTDGQRVVREQNASAPRSFTIVLKHFGEDPRWAMWSHDLANGMALRVNEANGSAFLDVPLDTLATAIGDLSIGLSYSSQRGADYGLSPERDLAAGPASSARDLPVELVKLGALPSDHPDAGVVKANNDGTFLYTAADGSTFTFTVCAWVLRSNRSDGS